MWQHPTLTVCRSRKSNRLPCATYPFLSPGQAKCDVPIMSNGVEACCKKGLYARNVKKLVLDNVSIEGCEGEEIELHDVDEVEW